MSVRKTRDSSRRQSLSKYVYVCVCVYEKSNKGEEKKMEEKCALVSVVFLCVCVCDSVCLHSFAWFFVFF